MKIKIIPTDRGNYATYLMADEDRGFSIGFFKGDNYQVINLDLNAALDLLNLKVVPK